jgi:hypothetical protein
MPLATAAPITRRRPHDAPPVTPRRRHTSWQGRIRRLRAVLLGVLGD